jgi:hypothetical protein
MLLTSDSLQCPYVQCCVVLDTGLEQHHTRESGRVIGLGERLPFLIETWLCAFPRRRVHVHSLVLGFAPSSPVSVIP